MKFILPLLISLISTQINAEDLKEIIDIDNLNIASNHIIASGTNTTDEEFSSVVFKMEIMKNGQLSDQKIVTLYDVKPRSSWKIHEKVKSGSNGILVTEVITIPKSIISTAKVN